MDRTGEELSVERQVADQRALATVRGWDILKELIDNDVSADGKRKRPGFEAALRMVRDGHADMIIATDMTRLTRGKALDEVRLLELGVDVGLKLSFVRAPDLDLSTAAGRLTASILIAAARHEIEQKSERQKRAAQQAAQQGRRIGGRRPFGFGLQVGVDERTGRPILDYDQPVPEEADAIRDAYDAILRGVSLGRIAKDWNAKGLFTPQSPRRWEHGCAGSCADQTAPDDCPDRRHPEGPSEWTSQTVRNVVMNPRYAGLRSHVGEELRARMRTANARLEGVVGAAAWPAVVGEDTFWAVVEKLTDPSRANPGRTGIRLLTGLAHCGYEVEQGRWCGATVHGGANPAHQPTYRCRAAYGHVGRRSEPVDAWVEEVIIARLSRDDAKDLLVEDEPADVAALRKELRDIRDRLNKLAERNVLGHIDDQQLRAGTDLGRRRQRQIEAKLARAGEVSVLAPLILAEDPWAVWAAMDIERRRAVVDKVAVVTLLPPGRGVRTFRPETVIIEPRGRADPK